MGSAENLALRGDNVPGFLWRWDRALNIRWLAVRTMVNVSLGPQVNSVHSISSLEDDISILDANSNGHVLEKNVVQN